MKKSTVILLVFFFVIISNILKSEIILNVIQPKWANDYSETFYLISSFDQEHLLLLNFGDINHFYSNDLATLSLINFTDWDTGLNGESSKNGDEIVLFGFNINTFSFPIQDYQRVYYIISKDTSNISMENPGYAVHDYDAKGSFDANLIYSNVSSTGYGISVAKYHMITFSYKNWKEIQEYSNVDYDALCGYNHAGKDYILAVNKENELDILSTYDGITWDVVGSPRNLFPSDTNQVIKFFVSNSNDYYIVTEKSIIYSKGSDNNWNAINFEPNTIKNAALRNSNELYVCGNNGLIAQVNLSNNQHQLITNPIKFDLLSIHFTNESECWLGGKSKELLKLSIGTGVENSSIESNKTIIIFPNPAQDYIMLILEKEQVNENETFSYTIYDINAKIIKSGLTKDNNLTQIIDVSDLRAGVYLIQINSKTYKFVKE
ncbi:hypothetical protein MASR1M45_17780 [Candidatus Kapaibacterium sp.]